MVELLDAIALLEHTEALTADDQKGLRDWYAEYLKWLMTSDSAKANGMKTITTGRGIRTNCAHRALYWRYGRARLLVEADCALRTIQDDGSQKEELDARGRCITAFFI